MKNGVTALLLLLFVSGLSAQDLSQFEKKNYIQGSDTLRYRILYPQNYKKNKAYPLVLFLHGSGERGNDNTAQLTHGASLFLKAETRKYFPAIVIFPQCPSGGTWSKYTKIANSNERQFDSEGEPLLVQQLVKSLIDSLVDNKKLNNRKLYIGGLSMGGMGTYDMLIRYPDYFAAAFSICGGSDVALYTKRAKNIPLWIFHGARDEVVSPASNRELYKALMTAAAPDVTYTEYPDANHNSWDNAFAEPRLLPWLFSNKKKLPSNK